jgi:preprotein translocase subunit SecY
MDPSRLLYRLLRVYVWMLLAISIATILVLLLPGPELSASVAGVWFAVGGFGALVLVTVVMTHLIR